MSLYFSLSQIRRSIKNLESVHPFFGITFLVCKQKRLPVGRTIEFPLDAWNKAFLDRFYKPDKESEWYFRVFRPSDKRKSWVASDYASSGLQSVNTRTFGDAFIHQKNSDWWGWHQDYVDKLREHLHSGKRIPAFDLSVWLFRDQAWPLTATPAEIVGKLIEKFSITQIEFDELFDTELSGLTASTTFQDAPVSWSELRTVIGSPPDASSADRVSALVNVSLSNVRSFVGTYDVPIKPLTLLVGENSSGKSTLLATVSAVCNTSFPVWSGLNEPPYNLGGFDTIATFSGANQSKSKEFSIGYEVGGKSREDSASIRATYKNNKGQVQLGDLQVSSSTGHFRMSLDKEPSSRYRAKITKGKGKALEAYVTKTSEYSKTDLTTFVLSNWESLVQTSYSEQRRRKAEFTDLVVNIISSLRSNRTLSIAPIRTKPKRAYDEVSDEFSPEGAHIPYVLARILADDGSSEQKQTLIRALELFGKDAGLFTAIQVKQLGDNISAPFQILVDPSGVPINLLDVGYGVSQALPIVVQSVLIAAPKTLLLQQPEVHLHPRAQAALGTFFSRLVQNGAREFIIETHSDFIIDRIRQEVAKGHLRHDLVQILFFEKPEAKTNVYPLTLDKDGNILNAPSTYRNFFLREELNLISRTGADT